MLNYDIDTDNGDKSLDITDNRQRLLSNNPFPGLRSFTVEESHLFFGRENQVDEVLTKLAENRFVTVLGISGSGKSSLIHCGVKPVLYGGFMGKTGSNWSVISSRPGSSPIENLSEAFLVKNPSYSEYTEEENLVNKAIISSILRSGPNGLVELSKQYVRDTGDNILIYIDQFEELFRFKSSELIEDSDNEAIAYVNLILEAIRQSKVPIYIAMTMRSDFLGNCSIFQGLTQMVNTSNYLVPQMTREQIQLAVEGPVAVGGGEISKRLVKRLLNDVGDNQDQLPILQHALMRTWNFWAENRDSDEPIDIRHYNAIGRLSQALSQHADEAYEELSPKAKEVASVVFKSITEKGNNEFGIRRPMPLNTMAEIANVDEDFLKEVIEVFRGKGRSILLPNATIPLESNSVIEISHESLMRIWVRLKNWVAEEYESAIMYKRLSDAAAMYQIGRTGLWRPPDLQLALNWQKKQNPTRAWGQRYDEAFERAIVFLDTSRITYEAEQKNQEMLQKRLLRRARIVAVVLGIAAVISILFLVFAYTQKIQADKNFKLAEERRIEAEGQKKKADEQTVLARQESEKALVANRELQKTLDRLQVALDETSLARAEAIKQAEIAKNQTVIAQDQTQLAVEESQRANENANLAQQNLELADNLYMRQLAQSIAVKSLQVEDKNLKGLLAQQAYLFNSESNGRIFDPYIYDGLYFAIAQLQGRTFNTIKTHRNAVRSVVVGSKDRKIFTTGNDGNVYKSSIDSLSTEQLITKNQYANRILALSSDDKWLAIGSDSTDIQLINMLNKSKTNIQGNLSFVYDLIFAPDNSGFYSLGADHTLRYYDFNSLRLVKSLSSAYKTFDIDPGGDKIALGGIGGNVTLFDIKSNSEQVIYSGTEIIHSVKFSNDGKYLAIGDEKGMMYLWNMPEQKIEYTLIGHKARINSIEFTQDNNLLASASYDGTVQMWVMNKLDELPLVFRDNKSYIWDIAFTSDNRYLIAGGNDGETRIWPTDAKELAEQVCSHLDRNMTEEEWKKYVGLEIGFRNTCKSLLFEEK